jgi:hypothetical protein
MKDKRLASGNNRLGQFVDFRRGEKEKGVLRWFFQRLQKGVKRFFGQHMGLIDNVYLSGGSIGSELYFFPQISYFIDSAIGRGIDLDHIDERSGGGVTAKLTLSAGASFLQVLAQQSFGEDPGG